MRYTLVLLLGLGLGVAACGGDDDGGETDAGASDAGTDAGPDDQCTADADCDNGLHCDGTETCDPDASGADDFGCVAGSNPCMAGQTCVEDEDRCETDCSVDRDADGDGHDAMECDGDDCDDSDGDVNPSATEVCDVDGVDEDCDPTSFGDRDLDSDSFIDALCCNGDTCGTDCNDLLPGVNPSTSEVCDRFDNDCDGATDEGVLVEVWPDTDFDLHGDETAASMMLCPDAHGYATVNDDCDDSRPDVHPAQVEICDDVDNDCDDLVDETPAGATWYLDMDDDGFGDPDPTTTVFSCEPRPGYVLRAGDCDDSDASFNPGQIEACDGLDTDCNGLLDAFISAGNYEDDDADGHADVACSTVGGSGDDCNDTDPTTYPGATEICDRRDNDCNDSIDDGTAMGQWWPDEDGDTFGDSTATPTMSCTPVAGAITRDGDCNDEDPAIRPGVAEPCDGVDNDCDEDIDEGVERRLYYDDADGDGHGDVADTSPVLACTAPANTSLVRDDCDDSDDTVTLRVWHPDDDDDTYGDASAPAVVECTAPADHIADDSDCDDTDPAINPDGTETCNGDDDDCNGTVDDDPAASGSCTLAEATAICSSGACAIDACNSGWDDCNTTDSDGCETNIDEDPMHCGMCSDPCSSGELCRLGVCDAVVSLADSLGPFMCAVLLSGTVKCWGNNNAGQLGRGSVGGASGTPALVQDFLGAPLAGVAKVSLGVDTACAVLDTGAVYCWGDNSSYQLGNDVGTASGQAVPAAGITNAVDVSVGPTSVCAVLDTGAAQCWGRENYRNFCDGGTGATGPTFAPVDAEEAAGVAITDATAVWSRERHTCFLRASGTTLECCGAGANGRLGSGSTVTWQSYAAPVDMSGVSPAWGTYAEVHMGEAHACAREASTDRIRCWGGNFDGQIGRTGLSDAYVPSPTHLAIVGVETLATGLRHTCFVTHPGGSEQVDCVGNNSNGQLGNGDRGLQDNPTPQTVVTVDMGDPSTDALTGVQQLYGGSNFSCALLDDGRTVCWGDNTNGQIGDGALGGPGTENDFADLSRTVVVP